jgi:hypothetical protein
MVGITTEIELTAAQAASAVDIQRAIDALGPDGGRVVLPAVEVELDRGLELRSNVALEGQGRDTVLRKAPGRVYPLSGYHNYGMLDVPLMFTAGLLPGMTVVLRDDRHGGFFETFARITWVEDGWVGLDQGLHSDYYADLAPVLVTAFPLIYAHEAQNVSVKGLTLDGNRDAQPAGIGACRGAAVYFLRSHRVRVTDVVEQDFAGEGLGFQMCSQVYIRDCRFTRNTGNGYHPGAGSTAASFENCTADQNGAAGFFFCVRANHITVRDCTFAENGGPGISVGTRDSDNLIESCRMEGNGDAGLLFRETRRPVEMSQCRIRACHIHGNARADGLGQVAILGDAHDLALEANVIGGTPGYACTGIYVAPSATRVWLKGNEIEACSPDVIAGSASLALSDPVGACGIDAVEAVQYRHLHGAAERGGQGHEVRS